MDIKRYLLFCGPTYYPYGGWDDFKGSFDNIEAAEEAAYDDWWHIVDMETGEIVRRDQDMPIDQEQLKQQIYNYLESLGYKMMPIENMDYNVLAYCLYHRVKVLERTVIACAYTVGLIHGRLYKLIDLLESGASIYDEIPDTLLDSIEAEFEQFLHSVGTDTQSAKERPAGSETESSQG